MFVPLLDDGHAIGVVTFERGEGDFSTLNG